MKERRQQRRANRTNQNSDRADLVNEAEEMSQYTDRSDTITTEPKRTRRGVASLLSTLRNSTEAHDNEAFENEEENPPVSESSRIIQSAIIDKHRNKSREMAQRIVEEDPNEINEQLHHVRDRIKNKIKKNLEKEQSKAEKKGDNEDDEIDTKKKSDLKLDLSMSTNEQHAGASRLTGRTDTSVKDSTQQRIKKVFLRFKIFVKIFFFFFIESHVCNENKLYGTQINVLKPMIGISISGKSTILTVEIVDCPRYRDSN